MIIHRVTDWIGSTPLLAVHCQHNDWRLYLKLEKFNPGGSMKDRMARGMVDDAERRGRLRPGGTIVESSSGNTGTGLALVAAERGYTFVAVVDHHTAPDKIRAMQALGTSIVRVGDDAPANRVATAEREARALELAREIPGAVVMQQHENGANPSSYVDSLATDLIDDLGHIDVLVGSVGTGGSLCGTAWGVRTRLPDIEVIGVEPRGSVVFGGPGGPYYQSGTGVPVGLDVGATVDYETIDHGVVVDDVAAFNACRFLAHRFGILVGGSAGGVLYLAAARLRELGGTGTMVALLADGGEKYLDTIFDDDWMRRTNLLDRSIEADLADILRPAWGDAA